MPELHGFPADKPVEEFKWLSDNLRNCGMRSSAKVVDHLIERVKRAEANQPEPRAEASGESRFKFGWFSRAKYGELVFYVEPDNHGMNIELFDLPDNEENRALMVQLVASQIPADEKAIIENDLRELQATFDINWAADQRAIKRWQAEHPGNDNKWPDRCDMVVWLLNNLDKHEAGEKTLREALEKYHSLCEKAIGYLQDSIIPDSGVSNSETVNRLLGVFDGPEQRDAFEARADLRDSGGQP